MSEQRDDLIGQLVLGRYRIVQLLARGGMAAVFLARVEGAAGFSKPVVVKRILPHLSGSSDDEAHFVREARILSSLHHPSIVNVLDFGRLDESHLMVLEYVHGYHLGQWLKYVTLTKGRLPWETCVWVILQVLSALHYAHTYARADGSRAAIVHRDISPANILIDLDGTVRLADFGIARIETEQTSKLDSKEGTFRGKFPYAAPELFDGGSATTLTDVYACGVVLYQLLAGTNPFTAEDAAAIVRRVLTHFPPPVNKARSDVPVALDLVLGKAISKEPEDRHASAKELATALRAQLTKSEAEIATETAALIRRDFTGDLPRLLQLESLESLEIAWHKAISQSNIPLDTGKPPGEPTARAANSQEPTVNAATIRRWYHRFFSPTLAIPMLLGASITSAVALAASLFIRAGSANQPQFLIVESRDDVSAPSSSGSDSRPGDANRSATLASAHASASLGAGPGTEPAEVSKSSRSMARTRDPQAALSAALSRHQGEIQTCFKRHATEVQGSPQLAIRFSVDVQGKVLGTSVSPASIAATALGDCLVRVARTTNFGPQDKPLEFSIPITARTH